MEAAQTQVEKYLGIVSAYDTEFKKWCARVDKILKKYRDDNRSASGNDSAKFNILWSNVQTLVPAVYARMPKASVSRRFVDNDPVGRVGALLIERCLDYEVEHFPDYRSAMHNCVLDRFLGGRGVSWVRYDPTLKAQDAQITEDVPDPQDMTGAADEQEPAEEIEYESSPTDYVHWKDFGHSVARTWEEVTCVWRWVYMGEEALKARFPETWKKVPLKSGPEKLGGTRDGNGGNDKAKVCELWDKEADKVVFFAKDCTDILDERADPLELEGFFPTPKPLYATLTTDSLVPVPDFVLYQDQANELDILSDRIDGLVKALRVRGIYDGSQPTLQRLLTEGENNLLIGTDKWAAFSEKGGLKGSIDLLPLEPISAALMNCYQARQDIKAQIFEITGLSDIVRGQGAASETATAQQIKGQYAGLRLKAMQETVSVFASELLRIKAQIICTKYQDQTILAYAGAEQMSKEDQAMIPAAMQLIRNDPLRCFRIEVAADSLVQIDEMQTKQERVEFLGAMANFLREAVPAGQQVPELVPAMMAMMQFGIAGFKQARTIEGALDAGLQKLMKKAQENEANPPPDPEMQKAQAQAQADAQKTQAQVQAQGQLKQMELQHSAQMEQMRAQAEGQREQMRTQAEAQRTQQQQQHEAQMKQMEIELGQRFDKWEAELKAATSIDVALISAGKLMPSTAAAAEANIIDNLGQGMTMDAPELQNIAPPPAPKASGASPP